jgi:hypothetical protein
MAPLKSWSFKLQAKISGCLKAPHVLDIRLALFDECVSKK